MRKFSSFLKIILPLGLVVAGLTPSYAQSHALPPPVGGITFEDVIRLSHAGLSDKVIIAQIHRRTEPFDLTPEQLLQLKTAHVSDPVIEAMAGPPNSTPVVTIKPSAPIGHQAVPPVAGTGLPSEIGMYVDKKGSWTELLPEIVNWKTGGVLKNVATVGVVKGDVNGHVNGSTSANRFTKSTEFLIVMPEGREITEYQLLELHQNGNNREFRIVTGGVLHVSSGATRDLLAFEQTKIASRTYEVTLPNDLHPGEYGILPPGAVADLNGAGSRGKLYSFRVIE